MKTELSLQVLTHALWQLQTHSLHCLPKQVVLTIRGKQVGCDGQSVSLEADLHVGMSKQMGEGLNVS